MREQSFTRASVLVAGIVFVMLLGAIDYATGWELQFFVFYFMPVGFIAWILGANVAYGICFLSAVVWVTADRYSGHVYGSTFIEFWNTAIRLFCFLLFAYSSARIRATMKREHEIKQELTRAREHLEQQVEEQTRELKLTSSRMIIQAKMASMGQLAAGIAHEINNPINFVSINFGTLKNDIDAFRNIVVAYRDLLRRLPSGKDMEGEIEKIRKQEQEVQLDFVLEHIDRLFTESRNGLRRVTEIVNSMRDFSRLDSPDKFTQFNINKGVQDTLVIARNSYKYCAEVCENLGNVPEIVCVPDLIKRVLLNLIVNAAQAIEEQASKDRMGKITITTYADVDNVYCEVADTGHGISHDVLEKLFQPFFTTKAPGKGTGLGLSISYDIVVNKHDGNLSVTSKAGEGSRFLIRLPIVGPCLVRNSKTQQTAEPATNEKQK